MGHSQSRGRERAPGPNFAGSHVSLSLIRSSRLRLPPMKKFPTLLLAAFVGGGVANVLAQTSAPIPEPTPLAPDQAVVLASHDPIFSLEAQVKIAGFDQRGALATAFDEANRAVDARVAELRAAGYVFADEAANNLVLARDRAQQAFRDLSLTTNDSWTTARYTAVLAMRRIRGALQDLERTSARTQG